MAPSAKAALSNSPFFNLPQEIQDKIHEYSLVTVQYRLDLVSPLVKYSKPAVNSLLVNHRFASDHAKSAKHELRFSTNIEDLEDVMNDPHTILEPAGIPYDKITKLDIVLTERFDVWHPDYLDITTKAGSNLADRLIDYTSLQHLHVMLRAPGTLTYAHIAGFQDQLFATPSTAAIKITHMKTNVETGKNMEGKVMARR